MTYMERNIRIEDEGNLIIISTRLNLIKDLIK